MSENTPADVQATEATTGQEPTPTPADLAAQATPEPPAPETPTAETPAETFDREYVEKLRTEAAKYRTRAKEIEDTKAAELDAFKQEMAKALGLVEDTADDPAALLEAAQAERDKMAEQLNAYRRDDAIRTALKNVDGKVDETLLHAVLNSNNAFRELEITSDDYADQVSAMIATAIENHPSLIVQATPPASGVDTTNTNTGADRKITREDLANMTATEINQAARDGKLNHLMNK